jgi:hypothetical protein
VSAKIKKMFLVAVPVGVTLMFLILYFVAELGLPISATITVVYAALEMFMVWGILRLRAKNFGG